MNTIVLEVLGGLAAGVTTAAGALPVLIGRSVSRRTDDILLAFPEVY